MMLMPLSMKLNRTHFGHFTQVSLDSFSLWSRRIPKKTVRLDSIWKPKEVKHSTTSVVNFYNEHVCCPSVHERQLEQKAEDQERNSGVTAGGLLCVKPDSVSEPLRTSSIELVHLVTITVESKCGCVANILSCLCALVNISIDEQCICMIIAQVTKCWQHFSTCMAPDRYKQKDLSEVQPIFLHIMHDGHHLSMLNVLSSIHCTYII
jgi:hypothetical protein